MSRPTEVEQLGYTCAIGLGLWLLLPLETGGAIGLPLNIVGILPEPLLGLGLVVLGAVGLASMMRAGRWWPRVALSASFALVLIWLQIATAILLGNAALPGGPIILIGAAWTLGDVLRRARRDYHP